MSEHSLSLLDALVDPALLCDRSGRVLASNKAAHRWFRLESPHRPVRLFELFEVSATSSEQLAELWRALDQGLPWKDSLSFRSESGQPRRALIRVAPHDWNEEPAMLVQLVDITKEVERLEGLAERERANLLVDLLGSTAGDLGDAVTSLHWAANLADAQLAELPSRMRGPMLEMRSNARRLHDLFRDLAETMPQEVAEPQEPRLPGFAESGEAPAVRMLLTAATPVQSARLLDELRRADLSCVMRSARDREQAVRAALAGEVEVVLAGEGLEEQEVRDLVKTLAEAAPNVAVFNPKGVEIDVLVRGIRGAVQSRRRKEHARDAWRSIEDIALRDSLTSVMNRRALDRFARLEFARAERYGFPLALALFDMDYFKELNDSAGHAAGDRALQIFASALQAGVREMDLVARLGGDEFVVLMPHTEPDGALASISRLREEAERAVRACLPDAYPQPGASAGVAVYPQEGVTRYEDLLARADEQLYRAKRRRKQVFRKRSLRKASR